MFCLVVLHFLIVPINPKLTLITMFCLAVLHFLIVPINPFGLCVDVVAMHVNFWHLVIVSRGVAKRMLLTRMLHSIGICLKTEQVN
jgi:hypothetical protein